MDLFGLLMLIQEDGKERAERTEHRTKSAQGTTFMGKPDSASET